MAAPGFTPLGGSSRRYIDNASGEEISYREYNKRTGKTNFEQSTAQRQTQSGYRNPQTMYNKLVSDYKQSQSKLLNVKPSDIKVRGNSQSAQQFKNILKSLKSLTDKSATGDLHRNLVLLGRREENWTFNVGETPKEGGI